jgi:hypothetical protein
MQPQKTDARQTLRLDTSYFAFAFQVSVGGGVFSMHSESFSLHKA